MTTEERRCFDSGRGPGARFLPAAVGGQAFLRLALILMLALPVQLWAQQEEDLAGSLENYRNTLALGRQALETLELSEALGYFSQVIDGYKTGRLPTTTPLARQMVGQAWEGRALSYANLGRTQEAEADFESLVRFDVKWPLDRERNSPKIVALFDKVRARIVVTLAIDTQPAGAEILLNGEPLGRSPLFDLDLAEGSYALEVRHDGFDPVREQLALTGGGRLERKFTLIPNARGILIATAPAGVSVTVDGSLRGTTFGTAGTEYAETAARLGLQLGGISAPLLVDNLQPGQHLLKLERECHVAEMMTMTVQVDPNSNAPLRYEPMVLKPSLGTLSVTSTPAGAEVLLDGKSVGNSPLKIDNVCTGRHDVVVRRAGVGQWLGPVDVDRDRPASVQAPLRMTMAFLGVAGAGAAGEALPEEAEFVAALQKLGQFNVLSKGAGLPSGLPGPDAMKETGLSQADLSAVTQSTQADMVVAARLSGGAFERGLDLTLQSARYGTLVDRLSVSLDDPEQMEKLLARLDSRSRLGRPWIGVELIESHRSVNPIVVRVRKASPAAKAGVKVGDRIVAIGGRGLSKPLDLESILAGMREGSRASMTLQTPGEVPRQVNLDIGTTPVILRADAPSELRSRFVSEMSFVSRLEADSGRSGGAVRSAALLNLGVALMREGQCQAALREGLAEVTLPDGPGVSAGTVRYLEGICLEKLNRPEDARRSFELAAGATEATLWTNDGPPVAERAQRRLAGLARS